jgi:hypothetical protein
MTKQEFLMGAPFTISGHDYRFELCGTDGIICIKRGRDFDYFCNVDKIGVTTVTVYGAWLGFPMQKTLHFDKLKHWTDESLAQS